jgi:hypothetical protein
MKTAGKHFKFINSKTGNTIYYHTLKGGLSEDEVKQALEKVKAQVATQYEVFLDTIYWEEEKEDKQELHL